MTEFGLDAILRLVADRRRRLAVQHLRQEANGKTTIDDLVDRLHDGESGAGDRPPNREQLAIEMHHVHLPKLADHGVVDFDPERGTVRYRSDDQFERFFESIPDGLSLASS